MQKNDILKIYTECKLSFDRFICKRIGNTIDLIKMDFKENVLITEVI